MKGLEMKGLCLSALLVFMIYANPAMATLFDRGNGLIYCDVLDITFLSDVNYAQTSGYDEDGLMTWQQAMDWTNELEYSGYSDWRLPTAYKFNGDIVGSYYEPDTELGYLRHIELGIAYDEGLRMSTDPDLALFSFDTYDAPFGYTCWTSTIFEDVPFSRYYIYDFSEFGEYWAMQFPPDCEFYAWAVRDGDVAAVPEPATFWLIGLSFIGLAFLRKQKSFRNPAF